MLASAAVILLSMRYTERVLPTSGTGKETLKQKDVLPTSYSSRTFYWFLASIFVVGLGVYSILQILILYVQLDSPIGANPFDIVMIRNSASIATILASLLAGPVADKIGRKNALGLGIALTVVTPLLYGFAQNAIQMMVINSLSGVSMAFVSVVGYLAASDLIPADRRGRLFGQYNAVTSISFGIAGTLIGGPIADYLINTGAAEAAAYRITFQVASSISLVGIIIFALKVKYARANTLFRGE